MCEAALRVGLRNANSRLLAFRLLLKLLLNFQSAVAGLHLFLCFDMLKRTRVLRIM